MLKLGLKSKVSRLEPEKADGKVMEWRYDDRNMVTKALYDGEEVLDQVHDDAYRLTNQTFGQDLERVITFGRQDNLRTNDRVKDGSQIIDELNFDYTYAVDKNVLSETNPSGLLADLSFGVTYDDGNRVKTWNRVADYLNARESQTWNYDDAGNWNATIIDGDLQNRTNNGSDELTSIEGNALSYDSRGNLLEDQDGQKYTWDIDNRKATIEPSGGSDETTHQYDAFSRRVHREFGNTDEVLLWWSVEEYAEHENIGSQPTIQNDLHAHPTGLNTTFGRALEGSKHDIQYFHKNYLDHVYAVSDDRGDVIEHYRYTAFGEPEFYNESGEQLTGSAIDNDILWNVKRYSEASGLYMYLYRHYEAEHGRWPSRDPIMEEGGVNLYGFVGNQTLMYLDLLGAGPVLYRTYNDDVTLTFSNPVSLGFEIIASNCVSSFDVDTNCWSCTCDLRTEETIREDWLRTWKVWNVYVNQGDLDNYLNGIGNIVGNIDSLLQSIENEINAASNDSTGANIASGISGVLSPDPTGMTSGISTIIGAFIGEQANAHQTNVDLSQNQAIAMNTELNHLPRPVQWQELASHESEEGTRERVEVISNLPNAVVHPTKQCSAAPLFQSPGVSVEGGLYNFE